VTESLCLLDHPFRVPAGELSPEQWAIDSDKRIGEIFFGMDSAIECFVFALNAVDYLKSPSKFCDITTASGLKRIRPDNIACCNPSDKKKPAGSGTASRMQSVMQSVTRSFAAAHMML